MAAGREYRCSMPRAPASYPLVLALGASYVGYVQQNAQSAKLSPLPSLSLT